MVLLELGHSDRRVIAHVGWWVVTHILSYLGGMWYIFVFGPKVRHHQVFIQSL